ncbi:hypothetical protein AAHC03_013849 [Spirometra sp. Aus1]
MHLPAPDLSDNDSTISLINCHTDHSSTPEPLDRLHWASRNGDGLIVKVRIPLGTLLPISSDPNRDILPSGYHACYSLDLLMPDSVS